ncbi:MAG: MoaD/ThiS family protein [Pirellulales bacterium]
MPRIFIPSLARDVTQGVAEVEVEAATVREALDVLEQQFPGIRERLCRGDQLAPGIQVSIDAALTRRGLFARLQPGSEVHFLPLVGGGC